jgi:hypothetical protein
MSDLVIYTCLRSAIIQAVNEEDEDGIGFHEVREMADNYIPVTSAEAAVYTVEAINASEGTHFYFLVDKNEGYIITNYPKFLAHPNNFEN